MQKALKLFASLLAITALIAVTGCGKKLSSEESVAMLKQAIENSRTTKNQQFSIQISPEFDVTTAKTETKPEEKLKGQVDIKLDGYASMKDQFTFQMDTLTNFDISALAAKVNTESTEEKASMTTEQKNYKGFIDFDVVMNNENIYFKADIDREFLNQVASTFAPLAEGYLSTADEEKWWTAPLPAEVKTELVKAATERQNYVIPDVEIMENVQHKGSKKILGVKSACFTAEVKQENFAKYLQEFISKNPAATGGEELKPEELKLIEAVTKEIQVGELYICTSEGENPLITHTSFEASFDAQKLAKAVETAATAEGQPATSESENISGSFKIKYSADAIEAIKEIEIPKDAKELLPPGMTAPTGLPTEALPTDL